jgi:dolichol-phosphate mannosyltransferase
MKPQLSIVLPCRNEVGNIGQIIESIKVNGWNEKNSEIVVVNDGSTDGTSELLEILQSDKPNLVVLNPETRLGLGQSIFHGISKTKYQYVAVLDTDGIHDPCYLAVMSEQLRAGNVLIVGSRYVPGGTMVGALYPYLSKVMNKVVKIIIGSKVNDQLCGFFIAERNKLISMNKSDFDGFGEYFMRLIAYFEQQGNVKEIGTIHNVRFSGKRKSNRREMTKTYIRTALDIRRNKIDN